MINFITTKVSSLNRAPDFSVLVVFLFSLFVLCSISLSALLNNSLVHAADKKDWITENIIDDTNFTDKNAMSTNDIQNFLDRQIGSCDVWGTGKAPDGSNRTRAQYAKSRGWDGPPYQCINKYYEVPKTVPDSKAPVTNFNKNGTKPTGSKSAAWIIKDAANRYDISPKVLLVKIATESLGPLTKDQWPLFDQYRYAMGSHCPDSGPGGSANCDKNYAGFSIQMYSAAGLIRSYLDNMDQPWWTLKRPGKGVNGSNYVGWNVAQSNCGGTNLNIANKATAALYTYTPYQPNQAALNNMYGTGDRCSAYGNRNFWRVFVDWFGSTRDKSIQVTRSMYFSPGGTMVSNGDNVAVSFVIKNFSKETQVLKSIGVAVRDSDNNIHNFPFRTISLKPGESYEYYERGVFSVPGKYTMWIANQMIDGAWSRDWPNSSKDSIVRDMTVNVAKLPDVSLSRSLYYSPTSNPTYASTEDSTAASFKVINNAANTVNLPEMRIAAKSSNGLMTYYPSVKNIALPPGEEYEYYKYATYPKVGDYNLSIQFKLPSGQWSSSWPASTDESLVRERNIHIVDPPDVTISRSLFVSPVLAGQQTGVSYIVKNNQSTSVTIKELGVRATDSRNSNYDYPSVTNITLDPGEEYTYYKYFTFNKIDTYAFFPIAKVASSRWSNTWPNSDRGVTREHSYKSRLPNISLIRSMYHSPSNHKPVVGQANAISFVIKNEEDRTVVLQSLVAAVRDKNNNNLNFPSDYNVTLKAGETYEYYQYRSFNSKGDYNVWIASKLPSGEWSKTWPSRARSSIENKKTITVY